MITSGQFALGSAVARQAHSLRAMTGRGTAASAAASGRARFSPDTRHVRGTPRNRRGWGTRDSVTGMRQSAAVRVELSALADGQVQAVFRGRDVPRRWAQVAVKLDGVLHRVVRPLPGKRGAHAWRRFALPVHLMFATLDLLALPGFDSLLPLPVEAGRRLRFAPGCGPAGGSFGPSGASARRRGWRIRSAWSCSMALELVGHGIATRVAGARGRGRSRFRWPIWRRLRGRCGWWSAIGGMVADQTPIGVAANALGLLGCMDVATPTQVEGWALRIAGSPRPGAAGGADRHRYRSAPCWPTKSASDISLSQRRRRRCAVRVCVRPAQARGPHRRQTDQRASGRHPHRADRQPRRDRPHARA